MGTLDGPIALAQPTLPFDELAELRYQSRQIGKAAIRSLIGYREAKTGGFYHVLSGDAKKGNQAGDPSKASSATVVPFLIRSGRWQQLNEGMDATVVAQRLLNHVVQNEPWKSAGLDDDNPFTVAFVLELVGALQDAGAALSRGQKSICHRKLATLVAEIDGTARRNGRPARPGRVSIAREVANSYLTDLVARVLLDWTIRLGDKPLISPAVEEQIWNEAINSLNAQLALLDDRAGADAFEVGYAVLLAVQFPGQRLRPEDRSLLRRGLAAFFEAQAPDGTWPPSRRLFQYPAYGDAYCYEFEFLARLLRAFSGSGEDSNRKALLPFLPHLQRSITRLSEDAVALPHGGYGWASGHHRAFVYPESWSTASCFDVCDLTDRLVTDAVTTTLLQHLDRPRLTLDPVRKTDKFDELLDSTIRPADGSVQSLKEVLRRGLLDPIIEQMGQIAVGKQLTEGTARSAILFGPPGTSKTTYAVAISRYLGWTQIPVDPSHLLRGGLDNIHVEIAKLFRMLAYAERVVVFFDEIDELVRDRSDESGAVVSRFLTTSMLPHIIKLRESRKLVYLVATNHIETFDAAFSRPGRFDLVLPVMPPTVEQKLEKWPSLALKMKQFRLMKSKDQLEQLDLLTFDEVRSVERRLASAATKTAFVSILSEAARTGILSQEVTEGRTWRKLMEEQAERVRIAP